MIAPGQTTNVLLTTDQPPARYYMAAHAYNTANTPFDNTTTTAILQYRCSRKGQSLKPIFPQLPGFNDTSTATAFTAQLKSLSKPKVPLEIDESLLFTVGLGLINCSNPNSSNPNCSSFRGTSSLHGYQFYVIGSGFGNFDPKNDPAKFNLIDPPERNSVGTPPGGWVAIRFEGDNPGNMPNLHMIPSTFLYFMIKQLPFVNACHLLN